MKTAPKLQEIVTRIADRHGVDVDQPGAYLRLEQEAYGNLVIENIGGGPHWARISVTNYIQVGDDWIADPEIVVYSERVPSDTEKPTEESAWYPIEVTQFFSGWQLCAEPDLRGDLMVYDVAQQAELAFLADTTVATMLVRQEWLHSGTVARDAVRARTLDEIRARVIRTEGVDDVPF